MVIVIDRNIPELEERIRSAHPEVELRALSRAEITREAVRDADALIVRTHTRCNASLLEGSRVRLVGTATIGTNHIDTKWCRENGIITVNAPGCNAPAVMQYVVCSLHAAGFDPSRHTLGVVGKGNIGSIVSEVYRNAGTRVLVCDPPRQEAGYADEDYLPLSELADRADALTFHVPLTREEESAHPTRRLLTERHTLHPQFIVNASRGAVADPAVLLTRREGQKLIIDTWPFEEEALEEPERYAARAVGNAFIATPHIAGYSLQGKQRATRSMIEALNEVFGLDISAEGLADYGFREALPSMEAVLASYDPMVDSALFKSSPGALEALRDSYALRQEPR